MVSLWILWLLNFVELNNTFWGNSFFFFFLLYNIVLDLPYIDMNPPWMYMCSPSWNPLPHPSPSHLSGTSQCTSPKYPVSCIEPGQAIGFTRDNLHDSIAFSRIIIPSPSSTVSKRLFYTSFLFCCLAYRVIITIFLNSLYMRYYTVLVFFFLAYFTLYNRLQFYPPH